MKIAVIAPEVFPVPPVRGGAVETIINEVTQRLTGHDVHVLSIADDLLQDHEKSERGTFYRKRWNEMDRLMLSSWRFPFKQSRSTYYYYPYSRWAASIIRKIRPDVIWLHSRIQFAPWIRRAAPNAKIILSLHNESNFRDTVVWNQASVDCVDLITSCSQTLASQLTSQLPFLRDKSRVLYNGVNTAEFLVKQNNPNKFQVPNTKLQTISNGDEKARSPDSLGNWDLGLGTCPLPVILFAGRLVEEKGAHLLIDAFKSFLKKNPENKASLVIAGAHTFSDNRSTPYIDNLKLAASDAGDRIRFAGHVPREKMPSYFASADVFAFPSIWNEPFGMAALEAMAAGLPVIAFNQGGPAEFIRHEENGILVDSKKGVAGFEAALSRLLNEPARCRELGAKAVETAKGFDWKKISDALINLFGSIAPKPAPVGVLIAESGSGFGGTTRYLAGLLPMLNRERYRVSVAAYAEGPGIEQIMHSVPWIPAVQSVIPAQAGIQQTDASLDSRFRGNDKKIDVSIVPSWKFDTSDSKVNGVLKLIIAGTLGILNIPGIIFYLKGRSIDIVHLNNEILTHIPLLIAAKLAGCKVICHLHGWRPFTKLERMFIPFVDEFVTISRAGAEYYRPLVAGRPLQAIPNGLALNGHAEDLDSKRNAKRSELGISGNQTVLSIFGRLIDWKGQDIFIRALASAAKDNPGITGLIIGSEPGGNEYTGSLEKLCAELGVQDQIKFLGWQDDVWPLYAASDIVIHASKRPEPFGLVILEAMIAGKPVIATRGGGVSDLVIENETGIAVAPDNADDLAEAMDTLSRNKDLREKLTGNARQHAAKNFTMERNAEEVMNLYERVLNEDVTRDK